MSWHRKGCHEDVICTHLHGFVGHIRPVGNAGGMEGNAAIDDLCCDPAIRVGFIMDPGITWPKCAM